MDSHIKDSDNLNEDMNSPIKDSDNLNEDMDSPIKDSDNLNEDMDSPIKDSDNLNEDPEYNQEIEIFNNENYINEKIDELPDHNDYNDHNDNNNVKKTKINDNLTPSSLTYDDLSKKTVRELRELAREYNLPTNKNKEPLIYSLLN
jgi:hypothetical protein